MDSQGGRRPLTRRQEQIAALIAAGYTNSEIAHQFGVSPGTVANQVAMMLSRLGLSSRTQIAVWAVVMGLADAAVEHVRQASAEAQLASA